MVCKYCPRSRWRGSGREQIRMLVRRAMDGVCSGASDPGSHCQSLAGYRFQSLAFQGPSMITRMGQRA